MRRGEDAGVTAIPCHTGKTGAKQLLSIAVQVRSIGTKGHLS
jgi:hypothetical protein